MENRGHSPCGGGHLKKKHKDAHLLKSPKLEQVVLERNERRDRRSGLKKKTPRQCFWWTVS